MTRSRRKTFSLDDVVHDKQKFKEDKNQKVRRIEPQGSRCWWNLPLIPAPAASSTVHHGVRCPVFVPHRHLGSTDKCVPAVTATSILSRKTEFWIAFGLGISDGMSQTQTQWLKPSRRSSMAPNPFASVKLRRLWRSRGP